MSDTIKDVTRYMHEVGAQARTASRILARASSREKNAALSAIADDLDRNHIALASANKKDLAAGIAKGLDSALLDRLELTPARIDSMINGLRQIVALPDPIGSIFDMNYMPSGIQVGRMRVPLGVVGIIYESRPNVTADAAALCLKSGNATILRGGSEALHSNLAIADSIHTGLRQAGLPPDAVQVIATTDRAVVGSMIAMPEYVDVIIPRGGKGLLSASPTRPEYRSSSIWMASAMSTSTTRLIRRKLTTLRSTPRLSATVPAILWRHCLWRRESRKRCCPGWPSRFGKKGWNCVAVRSPAS